MKVCSTPGCGELVASGKCETHTRSHERSRGTRQERGYDAEYDARRTADTRALRRGEVLRCWRCKGVVLPDDYSLGHCDDDRSVIHGPEHLTQCNLRNTRGGCTHISHLA